MRAFIFIRNSQAAILHTLMSIIDYNKPAESTACLTSATSSNAYPLRMRTGPGTILYFLVRVVPLQFSSMWHGPDQNASVCLQLLCHKNRDW